MRALSRHLRWLERPGRLVPQFWLLLAIVLPLVSVIAEPIMAYVVALKDGRMVHFKQYHVADGKLYFTNDGGRDDSVPLDSINLDLTGQLNRDAKPPLELPGLLRGDENKGAPQNSLGEIARRLRNKKPVSAERVFTNDDVEAATDEDRIHDWIKAGGTSSSDSAQTAQIREKAVALAKVSQHLTEQEVAIMALGALSEIQFPGRDNWQVRLYAAHQRVYALLETCEERTDEQSQLACSKIDYAQTELKSLKLEGIKRANAWKIDREK